MEEQFILRVPSSVAERIECLLSENPSSSEGDSLDLSFLEDGRNGTFCIGNDHFPASLLDLPSMVESYKTYDDNVLIKTADIGQIIMVREEGDSAPDGIEYKHGLTPPMRDARRRRFRREPDLNPELVQRVEKDLLNIMSGATTENIVVCSLTCAMSIHVEVVEQEEDVDENATKAQEKTVTLEAPKKSDAPGEARMNGGEPERSDSDDSDDSI